MVDLKSIVGRKSDLIAAEFIVAGDMYIKTGEYARAADEYVEAAKNLEGINPGLAAKCFVKAAEASKNAGGKRVSDAVRYYMDAAALIKGSDPAGAAEKYIESARISEAVFSEQPILDSSASAYREAANLLGLIDRVRAAECRENAARRYAYVGESRFAIEEHMKAAETIESVDRKKAISYLKNAKSMALDLIKRLEVSSENVTSPNMRNDIDLLKEIRDMGTDIDAELKKLQADQKKKAVR
ncbi:hypothetical protein KJ780_03400 [Candidatus Micrarchaeota archaeon]|nr:hypothetical protein [Candidatus Micrarchaeota archaeon]